MVIPSHSNSRIFTLAPLFVLTLSLVNWAILPFGCFDYSVFIDTPTIVDTVYAEISIASFHLLTEHADISDISYGILMLLATSSLIVYGLILSG